MVFEVMMRLGATCRASCCSQLEFEACCGENQPLLRLFVDVAHQQLLRARSKRLRANLHFPRKLIAVWNTSPVPFFFFSSPQSSFAPPCFHMFTVIVAFSDDYARAFAGLVSNPFLYWADVCLNSVNGKGIL